MSQINHHIPDSLLAAYASGAIEHAFALAIASHVSLCMECRARLTAHEAAGGAVLEEMSELEVSASLKASVLDLLDAPVKPKPTYQRSGAYPAPIVAALKGSEPKWRSVGTGVKQAILHSDPECTARLLYIPPGQAVPDHGHNGLELTLVLQGSFSDETGTFGVGDIEVADQDLEHTPIAGAGPACICLAATDAPLRFSSFLPRLMQPIFRI